MWLLILVYFLLLRACNVVCHFPSYVSTPPSIAEQYCVQAEACLHDTIPVCGQNGDQKRTFLDICDLLEYACDTNKIYYHVEEVPGCPVFKDPKMGK